MKTDKKTIVIAAGGTGGHLLPALALALALREKGARALVAGQAGPALREIFREHRVPFADLPVVRLPSRKSAWATFPFQAAAALFAARRLLGRERPSALVGTGGYASAPAAVAALAARVPLYFCEQNLLPGRVTRHFSARARAVFTAFEESREHLPRARRVLPLGNPLRPFRCPGPAAACREKLGLEPARFTVSVIGGSQGARRVNQLIIESLAHLPPDEIQFAHLTGPEDRAAVSDACRGAGFRAWIAPFSSRMEEIYGVSDLIICRAGATTLAEITLFARPAILIPFPFAAEDHQKLNALAFAEKGAAIILEQKNLDGPALAREIERLRLDENARRRMARASADLARPSAAADIAGHILGETT